MRILYSLPATGSGHITRCNELLNDLKKIGKVDIFLSGQNSFLLKKLPFKPKILSKGLSLFYSDSGSIDYNKIIFQRNFIKLFKEIKNLPVENYDLIINDFEGLTTFSCLLKKIPFIQFGHQASFNFKNIPIPEGNYQLSKLLIKTIANGTFSIGIHFKNYDKGIFYPIIKKSILNAKKKCKNFTLVYLPQYTNLKLKNIFKNLRPYKFKIFSSSINSIYEDSNLMWYPPSVDSFNRMLIDSACVITGGGFETPAEALYLKKKIISIPIKNHFEQISNSMCLKDLGVSVLDDLDDLNFLNFDYLMQSSNKVHYKYKDQKLKMVEIIHSLSKSL